MNQLLSGLVRALRRRSSRPGATSVWRLLGAEVTWAARASLHPVRLTAAVLAAIAVGAILGPTTPGPVLGAGWRAAAAIALAIVASAVAHALLGRTPDHDTAGGDTDGHDPKARAVRAVVGTLALVLSGTFLLVELLATIAGPDVPSGTGTLSASLPADAPLLLGSATLLAGVLAAGLGTRLRVPGALLFLGLGVLLGSEGLGVVALEDPLVVQGIGIGALAVILFEGGLTTQPDQLRRGAGPGLVLATVGVGVTAGATALGSMVLLDLEPRLAWTIGAVVASTDAAAVFDLLRRAPLPARLAAVLKVESGANDPVAVLLTVGLISTWQLEPTAGAWAAFGAVQVLGGVAVGVAGGWVGGRMLRRVDLGTVGLYPVLALSVAGVVYGLTALVGGSGLLAVYVAGIVVAQQAPRRRAAVRSFHAALSAGVEVALFLLLGLLVSPSALTDVLLPGLAVTGLLLFVARPLAVAVSLGGLGFSTRDLAAVGWLGLRGAVPIVLATLATTSGIAAGQTVLDVVFLVVVASALVQGTTAGPLLRRLGLDDGPGPSAALADAIPLEDVDLDVLELTLPDGSPRAGLHLREAPLPAGIVVAALVRDGLVTVPDGQTRLRVGDVVVATTTDLRSGLARLEAWAAGEHGPDRT
jgi:potassium/hydrogen antiporter